MNSIRSYLERSTLKQSVGLLLLMGCISIATSYFFSRYKMTADIKDEAASIAKAYRGKFLEGDIKTAETQISELLHLKGNETVAVLNLGRDRIYKPVSENTTILNTCNTVGEVCFDIGSASIYFPIFFDSKNEKKFGYLYLSRKISVDPLFVAIVFSIFCLGFLLQMFGLFNIAKRTAATLSQDIEVWSERLNTDPKNDAPLAEPPFSELKNLKSAIEGLHEKIRYFEGEAGNKAKLLLLRGIAHDILGPVAQMQLYCATLNKASVSNDVRETLADIQDSLQRVSLIASQVKTLNETQQSERFDFGNFVQEEVAQLQSSLLANEKKIQLKVSSQSKISAVISRAETSRILSNLVQNALHASDNGSSISVEVEKSKESVFLRVKDEGVGIPSHLQKKVFEPDYTSKPGTGTGLGLAIVKHICTRREGLVSLESAPNIGTTVTVRLPLFEGGIA